MTKPAVLPQGEKRTTFKERYGQWLDIGALAISLVALIISIVFSQLNSREDQRRQAEDIYEGYLELALEMPEYVWLDSASISAMSRPERVKYGFFMGRMLFACETVLRAFPSDKAWRSVVIEQLCLHRNYLLLNQFILED